MSRASGDASRCGERKKNKRAGHRHDAFPPPDRAQFFHCGGFDPDPIGRDRQDFRDAGLHGRTMRPDLGSLCQERDIDIHDPTAALSHPAGGIRKEQVRRRTFPLRIGWREMLADIAVANGAEQRVCQRMQADIGIRMALEPVRVRDLYAAEPNARSLSKAVHIEACADPRFQRHGCLEFAPRLFDIGRRGNFDVVRRALDQGDLQSGPFGDRRIVREVIASRRRRFLMGINDVCIAERLAASVHAKDYRVRWSPR